MIVVPPPPFPKRNVVAWAKPADCLPLRLESSALYMWWGERGWTTIGRGANAQPDSRIVAAASRLVTLLLGLLLTASVAAGAGITPTVTGVRIGDQGGATRFVLDLTADVKFSVFALDQPYRLVIDLPPVDWQITKADEGRKFGVIQQFRYGRYDEKTSRLVLDLSGPVEIAKTFVLPPDGPFKYRLVVDVKPIRAEAFVRTPPPAVAFAAPSALKTVPSKPAGKPVIVLDPGHGGVDPGTIGLSGVKEKDITLAVARELRTALEATGKYTVILTRDGDTFVALNQRVAKSEAAAASLFISLHADSIATSQITGASVYTLSKKASDAAADALAARENRADAAGGLPIGDQPTDVAAILISLLQGETMKFSASFASLLVPELSKSWHVLPTAHRFAGFAVLKAPEVPSVLIELGYLSNSTDERALTRADGRKPVIDAIARAVKQFFDQHPV